MNNIDVDIETNLVDVNFAVQALYLEAFLESLQDPWEQLKPENFQRKYEEIANLMKESPKTLSVENDTAILGLTGKNGQKKLLLRLVKENGQWVIGTRKEVNRARISQDKFNYVYSSL